MEANDLSIQERKGIIYNKIRVSFNELVNEAEDLFNDLSDCNELLFEFCMMDIDDNEVFISREFKELIMLFIAIKTKMNGIQSFVIRKSK